MLRPPLGIHGCYACYAEGRYVPPPKKAKKKSKRKGLIPFRSGIAAMLLLMFASLMAGCTDTGRATRVLADAGYKSVRLTGYSFLLCGKDDDFSTGFEATSPSGALVSGAVCSGWFKGATIRLK